MRTQYATVGNINLADERAERGDFATKEAYDSYVDFLEDWDEALDEDMARNPDICDFQDTVNVGYGPDEIMTCGGKSVHIITFDLYHPESEDLEPAEWAHIRLMGCKFHGTDMYRSLLEANESDRIRNVHIGDWLGNKG